jgi:hypothetical protein
MIPIFVVGYSVLKLKINVMKNLLLFIVLLTIPFAFLNCNKENDNAGETRFQVYLTDGPGDYDHVYIDIQSVEVFYASGGTHMMSAINPGVYDLLLFNNGLHTLLTSAMIPSGDISQVRLILGSNNSVVVNGTQYPLQTPSAQQSGLKLKFDATLLPNTTYDLWLDFDADKSIVVQGNGDYLLKPVIRAFTLPTTGGITGMINPAGAVNSVYVITSSSGTISTIPNASGYFLIYGLPAGSYDVHFDAILPFQNNTIQGVNVNVGSNTNIGVINF